MARWGLPPVPRRQMHAQVRLRLIYSRDTDLKKIGDALEVLNKHRNAASYDLQALPQFASPKCIRPISDWLPMLLPCSMFWIPIQPAVPLPSPPSGRKETGLSGSRAIAPTCTCCIKVNNSGIA